MRVTKIAAVLCAGMLLFVSAPGWGMIASHVSKNTLVNEDSFGLSFGASIHVESGNMTYIIQGPEDGGWKSELEWPLESVGYAGGIVSAHFLGRLQLNAGMWKPIHNDAGTMKNSDWFYALNDFVYMIWGEEKAIYGEFDATVDATQADVNLRYDFLRTSHIAFGAMLGYSYTKWKWVTGDGYQISPLSRYDVGDVTGVGIIYEEEMEVPYSGLALSLLSHNTSFGFNVYTLYSPFANCEDVDDHVVRYKESTGTTKGSFFSVGGDVLWKFGDSWSLNGTINYSRYDLEGTQDQYFYGGEDPPPGTLFTDIDMFVKGSQTYLGFMIGYELK